MVRVGLGAATMQSSVDSSLDSTLNLQERGGQVLRRQVRVDGLTGAAIEDEELFAEC